MTERDLPMRFSVRVMRMDRIRIKDIIEGKARIRWRQVSCCGYP